MKYITKSEEETARVAENFAKNLKSGDVVCLTGDLGVGKTAFTKGLAAALGVSDYIVSPTFTLVNEYMGRDFPLYHFDVYRIEDEDELSEIGFSEYIYGGGISVIEWAEKIPESVPDNAIYIEIKKQADGMTREIEIKNLY